MTPSRANVTPFRQARKCALRSEASVSNARKLPQAVIAMTRDLNQIEGQRLRLRLVQPDDAGYIHGLRKDPRYNQHLSAVTGTVGDQRLWIERYKDREAQGCEFYFLIERRDDGTPCGVVRLYDITEDSFTWGSWILDHNKPPKSALESAVLSFGVGFEQLGLPMALVEVRIGNDHALAFYRRLGMTELRRDDRDIYFIFPRARLEADRTEYMAILQKAREK